MPSHSDPLPDQLGNPDHRARLAADARAQVAFFRASLNARGGFDLLDHDGRPIPGIPQELHVTTRMVHACAMAHVWGLSGRAPMIDAGMACLWNRHRDDVHGGHVWALGPDDGVASRPPGRPAPGPA